MRREANNAVASIVDADYFMVNSRPLDGLGSQVLRLPRGP